MPTPITFAPRRGAILICDFGKDRGDPPVPYFRPVGVWPEITKVRRAVVVSSDKFNAKHGRNAGHCTVVPISTTPERPVVPPYHVPLLAKTYRPLTADGWAKCNLPYTVSHDRLYVPRLGGNLITNAFVTWQDLALIEAAMREVLGL